MTRAALVAQIDGEQQARALPMAGGRIGRGAEAAIHFDDSTISRIQASLRLESDLYVVENLSETNPTKVNDVAIDRPVPLSDGDRLLLGTVPMTFHDLAAGDRLSGPMCSHCARENQASDLDCWFCGTSLVHAPTTILARRAVAGRLIGADGTTHDLLSGQALTLDEEGPRTVRAEETDAALVIAADSSLRVGDGAGVIVNGEPASSGTALSTGDRLNSGDRTFLVIARTPDA